MSQEKVNRYKEEKAHRKEILAKEKRQIEQLGKQGILSEKESCPMLDALDEQYASLSSYGLSKSFSVMDK